MPRHLLLALLVSCLVVFLSGPLPAADEVSPAVKAKVKQLVEQLADPDEDKQEAAARELVKLGPDILPLLPGPAVKLKESQRKHLAAVTKTLRDAQAQKSLAPRTVTLQGDAIPLAKALAELARQTDIKVEDRRQAGDQPKLRLDLKKAPFWQALDTIAKEADARVYPFRGETVALVDGPHQELPTSYNGIFRTRLRRIVGVRDLETDGRYYVTSLEVAWEPRFRPLLLDTRPQSLVVKDDKDRALSSLDEGGGKTPVENPLAMVIDLRLPAPPRSAAKLNLLQGSLAVVGPSKMLEFTFDPLDVLEKDPKARELTREGVTVKLAKPDLTRVGPKKDIQLWKLEVSMEYPADGPDFESFQSWLVNNKIYLQKEKTEERIEQNGGYATDAVSKNKATVTYNFIETKKQPFGRPADWRVVYQTPGAIVEVPVPFEFKDLPLP